MFILSCTARKNNQKENISSVANTNFDKPVLNDTLNPKTEIIETFTDSLNIGRKGECKIELIKHRVFDNLYVIVKFYTKGPEYWYIQNTYVYECDALMSLEPNIADFNNDQFNDITFISATAGRGANEVRRLFIYDDYEKQLVSLVNSQDYPNMLYNKELDCIDAFLVYGGCSTVFLKINGDSLRKFASVDLSDGLTVRTYDKNGGAKIIFQDTTNHGFYIRYKNFKPLKEY